MPQVHRPLAFILLALLLTSAPLRADQVEDAEAGIVELHKSEKLYDAKSYKTVRAAFTKLFEARHDAEIQSAYGDDAEKFTKWLNEHVDIKENFYTALHEKLDKIEPALKIFHQLWKASPAEVEKYPDLAIATAVVWDHPPFVYDYRGHQMRTKSRLVENFVEAKGNFDYIIANEKITEGRCRYMPWEFLCFVIDHRTPDAERKWAQTYYLTHKTSASWHQDVPYDMDMLKGERMKDSAFVPRLKDRDYTLPNLLQYGGVCTNQADFASRVGKSIGMPSVYCRGDSAYRGGHAWWLYVQIQRATADQLTFTLVSDGRYQGFIKDAFYTGDVIDPQTGEKLLDRDLERRLALAGRDRQDKRHVDLLMRSYPMLGEKLEWKVKQRVDYLDKCLKLCPHHEAPWLEFVSIVKAGEIPEEEKKTVRAHITSAQNYFKTNPDFLWRIYDELLSVYEPTEQVKLYQQAVVIFEKGTRPDLSCDARLKITEALVAQKKWQLAADGLMATIGRFPTEGRYVPKMTLKLEEVCPNYRGGNEKLANLYLQLVPGLYKYYGQEDSKSADLLNRQALAFFEANKMTRQADALKALTGRR